MLPQLQPLDEPQLVDFYNLRQSSQQAEDALTQGMEKLQQNLALTIAGDQISGEIYGSQMATALEKLEALETFVGQVMYQLGLKANCINPTLIGFLHDEMITLRDFGSLLSKGFK